MSYAFDYLVVGSGLFGAVFAHEAKAAGKKVLVVEEAVLHIQSLIMVKQDIIMNILIKH